jgi:Tfp pilus assembly protein PilV
MLDSLPMQIKRPPHPLLIQAHNNGFSLVEALVALLIASSSLLGAALFTVKSIADVRATDTTIRATYLIADLATAASSNTIYAVPRDSLIDAWAMRVSQLFPDRAVSFSLRCLACAQSRPGIPPSVADVTLNWANPSAGETQTLGGTIVIPASRVSGP